MASCSYELSHRTKATRARVWSLMADGRTWKDWAGIYRSSLDQEGDGDPNGVGSIRRLGFPPAAGSREQVVLFEPPHRLGYVILSGGLPVKNYRSDLYLDELPDGGTQITWKGTFDPIIPGTGRLMEGLLHRMLTRFARRAAVHAERH